MLVDLFKEKMLKENLSIREIGRRINVAPVTISRLLEGYYVDIETMDKICNWLGVNVASALNERGVTDDALAAQISLLIEGEPALKRIFSDLLRDYSERTLSIEDVREIVNYVAYRYSQRRSVAEEAPSQPIQGTN